MASSILVDTNVWVHHFKAEDQPLIELLEAGRVVTHEFIIEELMLGGLVQKSEHFHLISLLEKYSKVPHNEITEFINEQVRGSRFKIGLIDSYLLCTAAIYDLKLYTHDSGLKKAAHALGLGA